MQKAYGYDKMQALIDSGDAWRLEGSVGRAAMGCLESGACMLPKVPQANAYGGHMPSRDWLKAGTKGTWKNCQAFWTAVDEGDIFLEEEEEDLMEA